MADSQLGNRSPRLNPFLFPSDTDFRFVLLIVSVIGASLFIYSALYFTIPANAEQERIVREQCTKIAEAAYPTDSYANTRARDLAYGSCTAPSQRILSFWNIGGIVLLLGVAGAIYWFSPPLKIWRDKLILLTFEDAPEVMTHLAGLCTEAQVSPPPTFMWNPLNLASSGVAFGRLRRYYVALSGGLVTQFYTDRAVFRAVILHELAHLRNADVDKAYFVVAVWYAFLAAALIPFAVTLLDNLGSLDFIFNISWRTLALTLLVYLTRNATLRARERCADVRASVWDSSSGALNRVLESLPLPKGGRWLEPLRVHPDPRERLRMIDGPHRLFRIGFWDAFGTGITATIAFFVVSFALMIPLLGVESGFLGTAFIFAPLAVGVVGLGVWRGAFAALARGETMYGSGRLGFGLGLGFLLGQRLSFFDPASGTISGGFTGLGLFIFDIFVNCLLLLSMFLFFRWVAAGAFAWLDIAVASHSLRPIYTSGLIVASIVLTIWLGQFFFLFPITRARGSLLSSDLTQIIEIFGLSLSGTQASFTLIGVLVLIVLGSPFTLVALISLWAFPLAAWFWRKRSASPSGSSWAFLDPSSQPLTLPPQPPIRPGVALGIGVAGGVVFCLSWLVLYLIDLTDLVVSDPATETIIKTFVGIGVLFVQPALTVFLLIGVTIVAAGWVKRLGWAHGLFAAFVAACIIAGAWIGILVLSKAPIIDTQLYFSCMINGGMLMALPIALCASAIAAWVRRLRPAK